MTAQHHPTLRPQNAGDEMLTLQEACAGSDSLSWPHHDGLGWLHLVGVSGGVTV